MKAFEFPRQIIDWHVSDSLREYIDWCIFSAAGTPHILNEFTHNANL